MVKEEKGATKDCKAYRTKHDNFTELSQTARMNEQLSGATIYAQQEDIMKNCQIEKVVEWAKNCQLVNYRFHGENSTHIITVVLQYVISTNQYHLVSKDAKKKKPEAPTTCEIPTSVDKIEENEGEEEEILECGADNSKTNKIVKKVS